MKIWDSVYRCMCGWYKRFQHFIFGGGKWGRKSCREAWYVPKFKAAEAVKAIYITSSSSILYWSNSEYWTQKRIQSGNIHSIISDVHVKNCIYKKLSNITKQLRTKNFRIEVVKNNLYILLFTNFPNSAHCRGGGAQIWVTSSLGASWINEFLWGWL